MGPGYGEQPSAWKLVLRDQREMGEGWDCVGLHAAAQQLLTLPMSCAPLQ